MKFRKFTRVSLGLALGCTALGARADEELPAVHTLPCAMTCANSTGAVGVVQRLPEYPPEFVDALNGYVEAYVRLHYKINTDGHVSDIEVISVVGPKKFADVTVRAVKNWVYKPATLDGQPVAICRTMVIKFDARSEKPGARPDIITTYKAAIEKVKAEQWDDANSILIEAQAKPLLNLYERGMIGNLTSLIAMKKADYPEAHRLSAQALALGGTDLPVAVRKSLLDTRIKSAVVLGDMVDALEAQDELKALKDFDPSMPVVKFVEDARSKIEGLPAFLTSGKVPAANDSEAYLVGLYRRNFSFQDVQGSLDSFTLNCKQQAIESKVTTTAEWHVPKNWSNCWVLVRGAPGTTFKMAQLTD
jgi:TonB family protein